MPNSPKNPGSLVRRCGVRPPLTRERALSAAIAVADNETIGALTMRRLAAILDVEAMSLYHHFANKDEILDGMIDQVFGEIELPSARAMWKSAMRRRSKSVRAVLTRHPWAIGLMESRSSPGPCTLRHHDAVLGCLRGAGFSVEMAGHAFSLLDSYIYGFMLQELNLPFGEGDDVAKMVDAMMPDHAATSYPHLLEFAVTRVMKPRYRYGDEFDFGLKVILDALAVSAGLQ